ncbi:MAG TPA: conjugal transfer protein TrbL family protein, partial [Streptosporangiaceae bacterium]
FTGKILDALNALWNLLLHLALTIPDVSTLPQVRDITSRSVLIVDTVYVLAIIAVGVVVMSRETVQTRYGLQELGPRLVIGWVGANMSTFICTNLINGANALTQALAGDSISGTGSFGQLHDTIASAVANSPGAVLTLVIAAILAVLTGMLMVQWLVRLGLLVVVVGIAPVALACHGTPWTEPAAKLWWRTLLGTLGTVVLQALALYTALSVFLNPAANLPALGIPNDPTNTLNLFIVMCLLWTVVKIPGLMRRYVTKGSGGGASIGRFVILQQLTRALTRTITKVPVRAPTGAAGGGGGAAGGRISGPRPYPVGGGGGQVPPRPGGRGPGASPVGRGGTTRRGTTGSTRTGRVGTGSPGPRPTGRGTPGAAGTPGAPRARTGTANPVPGPAPRPTPAAGRRTNPPFANGGTTPPPAGRRTAPRPTPSNRSNPRRNP